MEMNSMRKIVLDGKKMCNKEYVHTYLQETLQIPGYFGKNLDALWDVLSTCDLLLVIELIHEQEMLEGLGTYGQAMLRVFSDAAEANENIRFTVRGLA
jgi:ribonuclease inhibitor